MNIQHTYMIAYHPNQNVVIMVLMRDLIFQNIKVVLDWLILVSLVNEPVQHILCKVYGFREGM